MPKTKFQLFAVPNDKLSTMDKLIKEFGLFTDENALRKNIINPEKVYKFLLLMRLSNVKTPMDRAVHQSLVDLSKEDYLAIFYCLDDNLEQFKLCHQGEVADKKRLFYVNLAILVESKYITEFLASISSNEISVLLAELDAHIALHNGRAAKDKPSANKHLNDFINKCFTNAPAENRIHLLWQLGLSASVYGVFIAWAHFMDRLNSNRLLVDLALTETLLVNAACCGNVMMFDNAYTLYEHALIRYIQLNKIPLVKIEPPPALLQRIFAAASRSGSEEMVYHLVGKFNYRKEITEFSILAWMSLGHPERAQFADPAKMDKQFIIQHAISCGLAVLIKTEQLFSFTTSYNQNNVDGAFLSGDLEVINFITQQRIKSFAISTETLQNALQSGNPHALLKAIELYEQAGQKFTIELLGKPDGADGLEFAWPDTPDMYACIDDLSTEYKSSNIPSLV